MPSSKYSLRHTLTNLSFWLLTLTFLKLQTYQLQSTAKALYHYTCEVQRRADRRCCLDFQDADLREMVDKAREMEETYGHYFDKTIVNTDLERTFDELRLAIDKLDTEAQWVPVSWVNEGRGVL